MAKDGLVILLEQITMLVQQPGDWQDKRNEVLQAATAEDKDALSEFASWFREGE